MNVEITWEAPSTLTIPGFLIAKNSFAECVETGVMGIEEHALGMFVAEFSDGTTGWLIYEPCSAGVFYQRYVFTVPSRDESN